MRRSGTIPDPFSLRSALESPRPAKWSLSMKLIVCALVLGSALLLAAPSSASPFFRPANVPLGEIVVPAEWAGIWSYSDTTYNCEGGVVGTSSGLDTLCAGQRFDTDPSVSCTGSATATTYQQHCTSSGEIFPNCNLNVDVETHGTRTGDSFFSVTVYQSSTSGTAEGCNLFPPQCQQINSHATRIAPAPTKYCSTPAEKATWGQLKSLYR